MFLDESGDHSLDKIDQQYPVFTLAGCIFEKEYYQSTAVPLINKLKIDIFGNKEIVLHSYDIRKSKGDFKELLNPIKRNEFIERMNKLMSTLEFTIISSCIRKNLLVDKYPKPNDPYDLAFSFLIERYVNFLIQADAVGEFSLESRGRKENSDLMDVYNLYKTTGNKYCYPFLFNAVIDGISFVEKVKNINGHQIADLVAYPIARHCMRSDNNPAFNVIKNKFRRSNYGEMQGFGYKEFPKE